MYYNDINEHYDSDHEFDDNEFNETLENEKHFDKYLDEVQKTYEDLKDYVEYRAENKELLQNLLDYMYLEPLFDTDEYKFSETFKRKIEIIKKFEQRDNIVIPEPFDILEMYDENGNIKNQPKQEWVVLKPKKTKASIQAAEKRKKRKERREKRLQKEKEEKMKERTRNIMKRYGFPILNKIE